jgi:hypothetical protein
MRAKLMHAKAGRLARLFHSAASLKLRNEHDPAILWPMAVQAWFGATLKHQYRGYYVVKQR